MKYPWLTIAIVAIVVATSALKSVEGFTKFRSSFIVIAGYGVAFTSCRRT